MRLLFLVLCLVLWPRPFFLVAFLFRSILFENTAEVPHENPLELSHVVVTDVAVIIFNSPDGVTAGGTYITLGYDARVPFALVFFLDPFSNRSVLSRIANARVGFIFQLRRRRRRLVAYGFSPLPLALCQCPLGL